MQPDKEQLIQIKELEETIDALRVKLKHAENDLRLTRDEYDHSMDQYYKIYSRMEKMVEQRTSELQNSQEVLEQKSKELQVMLDASPALIFYKDKHHKFLRVNEKFSKIVGLPVQEIIGKTFAEILPENNDFRTDIDEMILREEIPVYQRQETIHTPHGVRQIIIDRFPYKNGSSEVIGIVGFAQDVTELKKAEEENYELESQLRQAQKMESIGILASGIAHDFNNVMATVAGAAQLIEMQLEDVNLAKYTDMILSSVTRGKSITDRILTFSRTEAPNFQSIAIPEFLDNMYEIILHTLPPDVKLEIVKPAEHLFIEGDPSHLQQVILNACINASDAIGTQGTIILKTEEPSRHMLHKYQKNAREKFICIVVQDSGEGIPEADLQRIFEPFFTTKEPGKGTGLGLSVAYKILKQHRGWIDVESTVGVGTRLILGIPLVSVDNKQQTPDTKYIERSGAGKHILIVDDEEALRKLISERLKINGFKVTVASNGAEALKIYSQNHTEYQLVLTDIKMPILDGIGLNKKIHDINPDAKVIAITGIVDQDKMGASPEVHFDKILRKPITMDEMLEAINELLCETVS